MIILFFLSLLVWSSAAGVPRVHGALNRRQGAAELSSYDEACNIGYCSVMGATIGGWGGAYTSVSTVDDLASTVAAPGPGVVIIDGTISGQGAVISVGSGKTIIGNPGSALIDIRLHLNGSRNVILRNLKMDAGAETHGEAITIEGSRSVWLDHCDLSSVGHDQRSLTKGLVSVTGGSDYLTMTANFFHDHPQAVEIGDSDTNLEDRDTFHITFARNHLRDVGNAVSFRFGTGHIFNTYFENVANGVNTRMGARLLIESSVFEGQGRAVYSEGSTEPGYATLREVILNDNPSTAPAGDMTIDSIMYPYDWYIWETAVVQESVTQEAGQILQFLQNQ